MFGTGNAGITVTTSLRSVRAAVVLRPVSPFLRVPPEKHSLLC